MELYSVLSTRTKPVKGSAIKQRKTNEKRIAVRLESGQISLLDGKTQ